MSRWMMVVAVVAAGCSSRSDAKPKLSDPGPSRDANTKCEAHKGNPDAKNTGCKSDADCKEHAHGYCAARGGGHELASNRCEYDACFTDADCGKGTACECGDGGNYCAPAACRSSKDCGGAACSQDRGCRGGARGFSCHSNKDECNSDQDCTKAGTSCHFSSELGHWACTDLKCPVG